MILAEKLPVKSYLLWIVHDQLIGFAYGFVNQLDEQIYPVVS